MAKKNIAKLSVSSIGKRFARAYGYLAVKEYFNNPANRNEQQVTIECSSLAGSEYFVATRNELNKYKPAPVSESVDSYARFMLMYENFLGSN